MKISRVELAKELIALAPVAEFRMTHEDFDLLFPPEVYGIHAPSNRAI
jgi:hypothetical protein